MIWRADPFIGGGFLSGFEPRLFINDPVTGRTMAETSTASVEQVDQAVQGAYRLLPKLRQEPVGRRAARLHRIAAVLQQGASELSALLAQETGKPQEAAAREVAGSAALFEFYGTEATRLMGKFAPALRTNEHVVVSWEPIGVVGAIAPFNYPLTLMSLKIAPALAAGCPVVAKPAPETSLTLLKVVELCHAAGIEADLVNVVTGSAEVGQALVGHPLIAKVSFTGSVAAGRAVAAAAGRDLKRLTLELGGQSAALIAADADLDTCVPVLVAQAFDNAGQFCYRPARFFVEEDGYDVFLAKFRDHAMSLVVGAPTEPGVNLGPLRLASGYDKVVRHVEDALARGARLVCGGQRLRGPRYDGGYFYPPTVLANASPDMIVMQEETFGPVVAVARVKRLEDAVAQANRIPLGLAGYVYCRDLGRGWRIADALEAGSVWVNAMHHTNRHVPFGGRKASGLGREKGVEGLMEYVESKTVYLGLTHEHPPESE